MSQKKNITLEMVLTALYIVVIGLAIYVWGNQLHWRVANLNKLTVFPLLGLAAFSIMWVHYVSAVIRDYFFPGQSTKRTFMITSYTVLALIILHPGLLLYTLYKQGAGLPPGSYKSYVGAAGVIYVFLGTIAFAIFMFFETKRIWGKKSWWKYISTLNDIAIILIMIHSLKLGQHLQTGWFRYVWYFYIVTLLLSLGRSYYLKLNKPKKSII